MPLGRLPYIDAEWGTSWGPATRNWQEVVREACDEQLRTGLALHNPPPGAPRRVGRWERPPEEDRTELKHLHTGTERPRSWRQPEIVGDLISYQNDGKGPAVVTDEASKSW